MRTTVALTIGLLLTGSMAFANDLPPNAEVGKCYARVFQEPTYRTYTEEFLLREQSERIVVTPPTYERVTEQVLVKPAYTHWTKGRGLIEKVNNFTGEIMCLKEVPAEYRTVTKLALKTKATVTKVDVPAEYQTVTKIIMETKGQMVWQEVMCETNSPKPIVPAKVEPKKQKDWFFLWDYDRLFNDGEFVEAEK